MAGEIVRIEPQQTAAVEPVKVVHDRMTALGRLMREVLKPDLHYGIIPGSKQPSLWKPGAEKIALMLGISVTTEVVQMIISAEEVTVRAKATATDRTGALLGTHEAMATSMEEKWRWRAPVCHEEWDEADPGLRREKWTKGYGDKPPQKIKQVRVDAGDKGPTLLAMACKRAAVGVVRSVTAASDIFDDRYDDDQGEEQQPRARAERSRASAASDSPEDPAEGCPIRTGPPSDAEPGQVYVLRLAVAHRGTNDRGPFTLWKLQLSDGREPVTFSLSHARSARTAIDAEAPVKAATRPGKKPNQIDLTGIDPA